MVRTSLVLMTTALLVAAGLWLGFESEPELVAVERGQIDASSELINPDLVNIEPLTQAEDVTDTAPLAPAGVKFAELLIVVRDAGDLPLRDVRITLHQGNDKNNLVESVTGATGEAAFGTIPTGYYDFEVTAPGRPPLVGSRPLLLSPGEYRVFEIRLDDYALSIMGRVVDTRGAPVAGIELTVLASDSGDQPQLVRPGADVVSDAAGAFEVRGLAAGEYALNTQETARYSSAKVIVRAGSRSAMLMIAEQRTVRVTGSVRDPQGLPLSGVRVLPLGQSGADTDSDSAGRFDVALEIDDTQHRYHLRLRLAGYREAMVIVEQEEWAHKSIVARSVTLEPLGELAVVAGRLIDAQGQPIAGEQIHLSSTHEGVHYRTLSDRLGAFSFREVVMSVGYRLWVRPKGDYNDYTKEPIIIADEPVKLEVVLDALSTGTVTGRVIDLQGNPVPHMRLLLYSNRASSRAIEISSDAGGAFTVADVPAGMLTFRTRSTPRLHLDNIELDGGDEKYVEIILDKGWATLRGSVVDEAGYVIGGAKVRLHESGSLSSGRTQHLTVTDSYGQFAFDELGAGPYQLDITAPRFRRFTRSLDSQQDYIKVQLKR